jgi:hypothetical protein
MRRVGPRVLLLFLLRRRSPYRDDALDEWLALPANTAPTMGCETEAAPAVA